jgi:hypothetical protein
MMGNCLAGETCIFSHDPTKLMTKLSLDGSQTPPLKGQKELQLGDFSSFPSLQGAGDQYGERASSPAFGAGMTPPPGLRPFFSTDGQRPRSRPGSRQQPREPAPVAPALDDTEAFPSLGSTSLSKQVKKQPSKRTKDNVVANSLADVVKMSPSPASSPRLEPGKLARNGSASALKNGENSAAAQSIPSPKHIPWLETGERANKAYLKARQEAIKHGGLRNKFLQR